MDRIELGMDLADFAVLATDDNLKEIAEWVGGEYVEDWKEPSETEGIPAVIFSNKEADGLIIRDGTYVIVRRDGLIYTGSGEYLDWLMGASWRRDLG